MSVKFDSQKHHRKSIRLKGYDYSSEGAYYVTIVVHGRECLFGEIVNGEMILNEYGKIVQKWWDEIPIHFPNVELGAFVIMPNHVHGIIFITTKRRGEVLSPRYNPNYNIQNTNVDETNQQGAEIAPLCDLNHNIQNTNVDGTHHLGGETPPLHKPNHNIQNTNVDETNQQGGENPPLRKPALGKIIAYFKYQSTKEMNRIETKDAITKFWQRNYYEHIIRNEREMDNIWRYIEANPSQWAADEENPKKLTTNR